MQVRHKSVEDYFQALHTAGFRSLPVVRELHVTPEILARDPAFFGPICEVPLHLALALTRCGWGRRWSRGRPWWTSGGRLCRWSSQRPGLRLARQKPHVRRSAVEGPFARTVWAASRPA